MAASKRSYQYKQEEPAPGPSDEKTVVTSIRVDSVVWRAFRAQCVMEDLQIGEVLTGLMRDWTDPGMLKAAAVLPHAPHK